jgi:hypothetical protein
VSKENLSIWEQVQETPKDLIKQFNAGDGVMLNTVAPINRIKKATEIFSAYGKDWGIKNLQHKEQRIFDSLIIATLDAVFFYTHNNKVIEFEISTSLSVVSMIDKKMVVNFTYRKAIETDLIVKALSRLGFNADIYTDGELVGTAEQSEDLLNMELVEVGIDLKAKKEDGKV